MRTRPAALLAGLLAVACAADKSDDDGASATTDNTTTDPGTTGETEVVEDNTGDYVTPDDGSGLPELDAEALQVAIEDAVADLISVNGGPAINAYFEAIAGMDASCPTWTYDGDVPVWFDTCTSSNGTTFDGYGYQYQYIDESDGTNTWNGWAINTASTVTLPSGEVFRGAGGAGFLQGVTNDGLDVWYSYVQPGYSYDGPAADDTWLSAGIDPEVSWYAYRMPTGEGVAAALTGTAEVDDGGAVSAMVFSDLLLIDEAFGSCAIEPAGGMSVLDREGHWIDLFFDGPQWEGTPTPEDLCDGCGSAWYLGEYLGEVCIDWSPLSDWDAYPFADQE